MGASVTAWNPMAGVCLDTRRRGSVVTCNSLQERMGLWGRGVLSYLGMYAVSAFNEATEYLNTV